MGFNVPNWAQSLIAQAAGLNADRVVVRHENDRNITFLQHNPRREILVSKVTGEKTVTEDSYVTSRPTVAIHTTDQMHLEKV